MASAFRKYQAITGFIKLCVTQWMLFECVYIQGAQV